VGAIFQRGSAGLMPRLKVIFLFVIYTVTKRRCSK
jgi:hypothetical protein